VRRVVHTRAEGHEREQPYDYLILACGAGHAYFGRDEWEEHAPGLKSLEEAKEPEILDWSVIDDMVRVDDEPAYATTKALYRTEALMVGPSTGAVVRAALDLEGVTGLIVGISPDSGFKYASYFAEILGDEGLPTV